MPIAKHLADQIRQMFIRIENRQAGHITRIEMERFFQAVHEYDRKEWKKDMNDAATLFMDLVNCVILVIDDSDPSGRGRLTKMNDQLTVQEKAGKDNYHWTKKCSQGTTRTQPRVGHARSSDDSQARQQRNGIAESQDATASVAGSNIKWTFSFTYLHLKNLQKSKVEKSLQGRRHLAPTHCMKSWRAGR